MGFFAVKPVKPFDHKAMHFLVELSIGLKPKPQRKRETHHKLPVRCKWQHIFKEMLTGFCHSFSPAAGAKPTGLTRKRYNFLILAVLALQAQKPVGQNSALQIRLELFHHVGWQGTAFFFSFAHKCWQVFFDDLVTWSFLRLSPLICRAWFE